jgi:hypothetical protein
VSPSPAWRRQTLNMLPPSPPCAGGLAGDLPALFRGQLGGASLGPFPAEIGEVAFDAL